MIRTRLKDLEKHMEAVNETIEDVRIALSENVRVYQVRLKSPSFQLSLSPLP